MTVEEIREYVESALRAQFEGFVAESFEMMASEGGDGRFHGKVFGTSYSGLIKGGPLYLAVGQAENGVQIVRFGNTESLTPTQADLDLALRKELGIGA